MEENEKKEEGKMGLRSFLFENKTPGQTVAKNSIWLSISNFGGRLIKASIVLYGARTLGTAEWGVFSYAVTLAGFFTLFIDPGINGMLMREISRRSREDRLKLLSTTFLMKVVLIALAAFIVLCVAPYFSTLPGAAALLPIVALIICFDTIREFFSSFIRAHEKMEWDAAIFLFTNAAIVAAGFTLLHYSRNAAGFGWGYAAGTFLGAVAATVALKDYLGSLFSHFSREMIKPILTSAWPFAITGALGILLTNADILIISWMRSASEVGIYAASIRVIQVLYVVPIILQMSTLPLLSRLAHRDAGKFRDALEQTVGLALLASFPMAIGGAILGNEIMAFLFGAAYAPGGLAFRILMTTLVFDYPAVIISAAIFAFDRQKSLIITSAIAGISNIVFDLILIPPCGIAGSAVATLFATILSNWYLWRTMRRINYFSVIPRLKTILLAGTIMGAATILSLLAGLHVAAIVAVGGGIYFLALYLLREPLLLRAKGLIFPARA